jgi:hypothetical protein
VRRILIVELGRARHGLRGGLVVDGLNPGLRRRLLQGIVRPALLLRLVIRGDIPGPCRGFRLSQFGRCRVAPHGTERLALGTFDLPGVCAAAALQVKVLSDCVVKKTHAAKATRR